MGNNLNPSPYSAIVCVMSVTRYLSPARMVVLNVALGVALVLAGLLVVRDTLSLRRVASSQPPAAPTAKTSGHEGAKAEQRKELLHRCLAWITRSVYKPRAKPLVWPKLSPI